MPKTLFTQNTDLTRDKRFSFLTEDVVNTGSTIRIQSILGFQNLDTSSGQIVCIGEIGGERTEILRTSQNTAPSQSYKEITLRDTMNFDHPQDTKVYILDWNRADIQWASTVTGAKQTIQAYPLVLRPDQNETIYVDTSQTSGYYFVRFNETIGNTNSDWSDPIPYGGFDDNSVFSIKKRALDMVGEEIDGRIITHEFLNQSLWEARREYHQSPGKRSFRRKFNTILPSAALTGSYRIELPTDVEKPWTAENIYGVRIGANPNMTYYDKKEWDFDYINKPHTTLTTAYTVGARDLYVTSARDFANSGVVSIEGTNITYSAKSNAGGTLRISSDSGSQGGWNASAGSEVWQNVVYNLPTKFTVWADPGGSAYIYFNSPIHTLYVGMNIYCDYYRTLLGYDSDADILDEPKYDIYVPYLAYKIRQRKEKGAIPVVRNVRTGQVFIADADYQAWQIAKNEALASEYDGTQIRIRPNIDHLIMPI